MLHPALARALASAHIDDLHRAAGRWQTIRLAHRAAHEPRVAATSTVSAHGDAVSPRRADDLTGPKRSAIFRGPPRVELVGGGGAPEMAAQIANEIRLNAPLHKAPLPVTALETVVVPTADDGLQG